MGQGDTIDVSYTDTNPAFTATTWAAVDAEYFLISDVHCENILSQSVEVTWITSENANSTVHYGVDPGNLNQTVTLDTPYVVPHSVRLFGLTPQTRYYYDVESRDFRGNVVTADNWKDRCRLGLSVDHAIGHQRLTKGKGISGPSRDTRDGGVKSA